MPWKLVGFAETIAKVWKICEISNITTPSAKILSTFWISSCEKVGILAVSANTRRSACYLNISKHVIWGSCYLHFRGLVLGRIRTKISNLAIKCALESAWRDRQIWKFRVLLVTLIFKSSQNFKRFFSFFFFQTFSSKILSKISSKSHQKSWKYLEGVSRSRAFRATRRTAPACTQEEQKALHSKCIVDLSVNFFELYLFYLCTAPDFCDLWSSFNTFARFLFKKLNNRKKTKLPKI